MFGLAIKHAVKNKDTWIVMGITGGMAIAFFSVLRSRPFPSLMLMTFILMACPRKPVKQPRILLAILIFVLIVFGFRLRASYWNKQVRRSKTDTEFIERARGYSVFSTLTYTGIPWQWYRGVTNLGSGKPSLGINQIEEAYRYNPYNIRVLDAMGEACNAKGDRENAEKYFSEVKRICPEFTK